jgi:hypothetical protein
MIVVSDTSPLTALLTVGQGDLFVDFSGDQSDPAILTNYFVFGVTPPQYIYATITDTNGRILQSFSGYDDSDSYVELAWNFTDSDGVTPYTNDNYIVNFTSSDNPMDAGVHANDAGGGSLTLSNRITRTGVRTANWVISGYEEMPSSGNGTWINGQTTTWLATEESMYENLYFYGSVAEFVGQNGAFRQQAGESVTRGDRRRRELEARSSSPPLACLLPECLAASGGNQWSDAGGLNHAVTH